MDNTKYEALEGKKVLVVDDNPMNLKVAGRMLKRLKVVHSLVESGEDAINLLKTHTFDCILLDIQMPGLDGFETAQEIRQAGLSTPIIAYTAHALTSDVQKCIDAGMNEHLAKPVLLDQLAEKLAQLLGDN